MAIMIGSSSSTTTTKLLLPATMAAINGGTLRDRNRPQIFISSNPSHINIDSLSTLYRACNHSPHRFPSAVAGDIDAGKLAVAVSHSPVVVSVFAQVGGGGGERDEGLFGRLLPAPVGPGNGELVGFGRAISDLGLTASIFDVMVIPSLQRMGIGRMIIQRIIRMLYSKGIYDVSAICSEEERLFFGACGFGDDMLGSTTMMYTKEASNNLDGAEIVTRAGRRRLIAPPSRLPLIS